MSSIKNINTKEIWDKYRGWITTAIFHLLILVFILIKQCERPVPPPGQEGILVNLGIPDEGMGSENITADIESIDANPEESTEQQENQEDASKEEEEKPSESTPNEEKDNEDTSPSNSETSVETETDNSDNESVKKAQQEKAKLAEQAKKKKQEEERIAQEKKNALEAAKAKAEADKKAAQAAADQKKQGLSGLFNNSSGKGETNTPGNQGDPSGDPNSNNLKGRGQGEVGGGLSDRGVTYRDVPQTNIQETGKVVVNVCVDKDGNVISATYCPSCGSTITNKSLVDLSVSSARKYKFKLNSDAPLKQCGTISYTFKNK